MDGNTDLSARQSRVIAHLIAATSIEKACKGAKVSKATVYSWLKEEPFVDELRRQRQELARTALERMKAGVAKATDTLLKHLDSAHENISIRAAESIIAFAQKTFEHEELEQRMKALEERIAQTELEATPRGGRA
jgi:transposase